MFKKFLLLPALALSLSVMQPVFANADSKTCPCQQQMDKLATALQLEDAQKAQIKAIKDKSRENMKAHREQLKSLRVQMENLIMSKTLDESQLDNLISQKTNLLSAMMKERIVTKNQIYNTLNAKQQLQFQEMIKKWHSMKVKNGKCHCPVIS